MKQVTVRKNYFRSPAGWKTKSEWLVFDSEICIGTYPTKKEAEEKAVRREEYLKERDRNLAEEIALEF